MRITKPIKKPSLTALQAISNGDAILDTNKKKIINIIK